MFLHKNGMLDFLAWNLSHGIGCMKRLDLTLAVFWILKKAKWMCGKLATKKKTQSTHILFLSITTTVLSVTQ
jgi:hypothetical protein